LDFLLAGVRCLSDLHAIFSGKILAAAHRGC
jgi:hypothetical protein